MSDLPLVLCVDDEPAILQGLTLHLRRQFRVVTADSGAAALDLIAATCPPAVIVSDMRMPKMDGAALLKTMLQRHPETTRILLTGEASRDNAAAAVNDGQIFRFLTKPCSPDDLRTAVSSGVVQHQLVTAEKVLMQETLIGCINALIDVLAMTNHVAFGRANRVKRMVTDLAAALHLTNFWQLEAAAMLSQIGYISLPTELVEKLYYGKRLTAEERELTEGAPRVAHSLLSRIPRIESVLDILTLSQTMDAAHGGDGLLKNGADILRLVLAYDALLVAGNSVNTALQDLKTRAPYFGPRLLDSFAALIATHAAHQDVCELPVAAIKPGMVMLDDLKTAVGTLLVPKGFEVTNAFLERKRNFDPVILQTKVRVAVSTSDYKSTSA